MLLASSATAAATATAIALPSFASPPVLCRAFGQDECDCDCAATFIHWHARARPLHQAELEGNTVIGTPQSIQSTDNMLDDLSMVSINTSDILTPTGSSVTPTLGLGRMVRYCDHPL